MGHVDDKPCMKDMSRNVEEDSRLQIWNSNCA